MQIKITKITEEHDIRRNRKRFEFVSSNAAKWKPGVAIEFTRDPAPDSGAKAKAVVWGTAIAETVDLIEVKHDHMNLQKVGSLYVNGYRYSRSEAHRFAMQHGFMSEKHLYDHLAYKWSGKLVKWQEVTLLD